VTETGILLYPWDLQADGVDRVVDTVAGLGLTRIDIATAYHSAEIIAPRRTTSVVTVAEANTAHLPLPTGTFTGLELPSSRIAKDDPELYPRLKVAADRAGIRLSGWGVAFHNSSLATQHPDAAIVSCFGDRFSHGLCAANPAARRYAVELLAGISATGLFDRILAESVSYLLYSHGHPHELWGARLDVTTRYLLSLCFCEHCVAAGAEAGIDAERLRAGVAAELSRTWNAPFPAGRDLDDGAELASLHQNWPELAAYTAMRKAVVNSLVAEVATAVRANGARLDVSAAVWGRPAPLNWLEGVDIAATLRAADGFVLESYYPTAGEVAREIDHTTAIARLVGDESADLSVALTLWPVHHATRENFLSKVATVRDAGVDSLRLYNYGTATTTTLAWAADAVALMAEGGPR
jgi:hypothetical protein